MKKILSVILGAVMLLGVAGAFTGCGTKEDMDSFTVFVPHAVPEAEGVNSYNDLQVYKKLEEKTGMKVKYVHGEPADLAKMWTGSYYDVMLLNDTGGQAGYPGGIEKGVEDGIFWDLTSVINESAPDYLKVVEDSHLAVKKFTKTDGGKRMGMYQVPLSEQGPWYGYVVREDWLKTYQVATGKITAAEAVKELVTYQDWEDYLVYVKANLNNGGAPLFLYNTGVDLASTLNAGFHVASELYLKDGTTVSYGALEPAYKEYLELMKRWYGLGLIDAEFSANNTGTEAQMPQAKAWDVMVKDNYVPAQYAAFPMIYTWLTKYEGLSLMQCGQYYMSSQKPIYSLLPAVSPKKQAADTLHIRQIQQSSGYLAISNKVKSKEKVKKIVEWINYLFTDEGMMLMNYGIEGDTYTMEEGKPKFTDKITKAPDFSVAISTNAALNFVFGYDWEREFQVVTPKQIKALEETWFNDAAYVLPTVTLTPQEGGVAALYQQELKSYKDKFTADYIKGKNAVTYEAFIDKMQKDYKVNDLVKVYSNAYARYKNRAV